MKKILLLSVAALFIFNFSACKKENSPIAYYSYGELTSVNGMTTITTDKGNTLNIKNGQFSAYNNNRVYVEYSILKKEEPNFEVELYWIDSLLTKNIIDTTGLTQEEQDSIGYDPIYTRYAEFSGDYLMVNFAYKRYDFTTRHFINAVGYKNIAGDTVHITLRHNDQVPDNTSYFYRASAGFINLKISSWVPSGKDQVMVYLYDYQNNKSIFRDKGIYKKNTATITMSNSMNEDLGNY